MKTKSPLGPLSAVYNATTGVLLDWEDSRGRSVEFPPSVSGAGPSATLLASLYQDQIAQTALFGAPYNSPRTLTTAETPVITCSSTAPASDGTDPAPQRVALCGTAKAASPGLDLSAPEKAALLRWSCGWNTGLRAYWDYNYYRVSNTVASPVGSSTPGNQGLNASPQFGISLTGSGFCVDAYVDTDVLYIGVVGGTKISIWINDKLASLTPGTGVTGTVSNTLFAPSGAGFQWFKLKWSANFLGTVRIQQALAGGIGDLYTRNSGTIRPRFQSRKTIVYITDSFGGTGASAENLGSGGCLQAQFGPSVDFVTANAAGTGYSAAGSAISVKDRVGVDFPLMQTPSAAFVMLGQNDVASGISANAPATLAGMRALWPLCPIFVSTNYAPAGYATIQAKQDAVKAACAGVSQCHFIGTYGSDAVAGQWLTGTGKVGATVGDGNADVYCWSSDGIHPSDAGHVMWATQQAASAYGLCVSGAVTL